MQTATFACMLAPQVSDVVAERLVASGTSAAGMALVERGSVELRNRGELAGTFQDSLLVSTSCALVADRSLHGRCQCMCMSHLDACVATNCMRFTALLPGCRSCLLHVQAQ
jgi:hypothetical protein